MSCWLWKLNYNDHSLPLRIQMIVKREILFQNSLNCFELRKTCFPSSNLAAQFYSKGISEIFFVATKSYEKIMLQGHGTELHWYKNSVTFCTDVIRSFIGKSFQMRMLILGWSPPQGAVRPENKERVSLSGAFYLGLIK